MTPAFMWVRLTTLPARGLVERRVWRISICFFSDLTRFGTAVLIRERMWRDHEVGRLTNPNASHPPPPDASWRLWTSHGNAHRPVKPYMKCSSCTSRAIWGRSSVKIILHTGTVGESSTAMQKFKLSIREWPNFCGRRHSVRRLASPAQA